MARKRRLPLFRPTFTNIDIGAVLLGHEKPTPIIRLYMALFMREPPPKTRAGVMAMKLGQRAWRAWGRRRQAKAARLKRYKAQRASASNCSQFIRLSCPQAKVRGCVLCSDRDCLFNIEARHSVEFGINPIGHPRLVGGGLPWHPKLKPDNPLDPTLKADPDQPEAGAEIVRGTVARKVIGHDAISRGGVAASTIGAAGSGVMSGPANRGAA